MIDTMFERWAERTAPLVARATAMTAAGLDPACEGCRVAFDTEGRYWSSHTCEAGKARQAEAAARLADTLAKRSKRRPKGGVRKRSW